MRERPACSARSRDFAALLGAVLLALICGNSLAQESAITSVAPTNFVTVETIALTTKTPLGDATIDIPAGTTLTNFEVQGDRVKVWQGPFVASVPMASLQKPAPQSTPTPTPTPQATPVPGASTAPPSSALEETNAALRGVPSWLLPATVGALATYALLATAALVRARRRHSAPQTAPGQPPVVILPPKTLPSPAVVADGGRAIACPICGKNIPLHKVAKGPNHCPDCGGKFVGE